MWSISKKDLKAALAVMKQEKHGRVELINPITEHYGAAIAIGMHNKAIAVFELFDAIGGGKECVIKAEQIASLLESSGEIAKKLEPLMKTAYNVTLEISDGRLIFSAGEIKIAFERENESYLEGEIREIRADIVGRVNIPNAHFHNKFKTLAPFIDPKAERLGLRAIAVDRDLDGGLSLVAFSAPCGMINRLCDKATVLNGLTDCEVDKFPVLLPINAIKAAIGSSKRHLLWLGNNGAAQIDLIESTGWVFSRYNEEYPNWKGLFPSEWKATGEFYGREFVATTADLASNEIVWNTQNGEIRAANEAIAENGAATGITAKSGRLPRELWLNAKFVRKFWKAANVEGKIKISADANYRPILLSNWAYKMLFSPITIKDRKVEEALSDGELKEAAQIKAEQETIAPIANETQEAIVAETSAANEETEIAAKTAIETPIAARVEIPLAKLAEIAEAKLARSRSKIAAKNAEEVKFEKSVRRAIKIAQTHTLAEIDALIAAEAATNKTPIVETQNTKDQTMETAKAKGTKARSDYTIVGGSKDRGWAVIAECSSHSIYDDETPAEQETEIADVIAPIAAKTSAAIEETAIAAEAANETPIAPIAAPKMANYRRRKLRDITAISGGVIFENKKRPYIVAPFGTKMAGYGYATQFEALPMLDFVVWQNRDGAWIVSELSTGQTLIRKETRFKALTAANKAFAETAIAAEYQEKIAKLRAENGDINADTIAEIERIETAEAEAQKEAEAKIAEITARIYARIAASRAIRSAA
ncbi:MAG: hypothetical protein LBU73_06335 [Helicobacteraceae bacterium]|jgi:hypothetical protein|nr:hypothetical protein [Helicobacteraceae bacterium]